MRRLILVVLGALALMTGCTQPGTTQSVDRAVYITPDVRSMLAQAWDTLNPRQHERAYCLGAVLRPTVTGDSAWIVAVATRAVAWNDGPAHTQFDCGGRPTLHTHNPTTCKVTFAPDDIVYDYDSCQMGGAAKEVTWASPGDYATLEATGRPFDLIQFSRHGFTVYYPRRK